ncbi:hypothetical protein DIPPA_32362 [Diplonema papillatum]|nr:hypothetical protein DIPPA_32362 [Diplonema papillatum]
MLRKTTARLCAQLVRSDYTAIRTRLRYVSREAASSKDRNGNEHPLTKCLFATVSVLHKKLQFGTVVVVGATDHGYGYVLQQFGETERKLVSRKWTTQQAEDESKYSTAISEGISAAKGVSNAGRVLIITDISNMAKEKRQLSTTHGDLDFDFHVVPPSRLGSVLVRADADQMETTERVPERDNKMKKAGIVKAKHGFVVRFSLFKTKRHAKTAAVKAASA